MSRVYIVPEQFIAFMRTIVGTNGTRLNLDVKDANGNTVIGEEEWNSEEFASFHEIYSMELATFVPVEFEQPQKNDPFNR